MEFDKKRKIVRTYIRNNPNCTYREIRRDTKLKIERLYKNMKEAYFDAGVIPSKNLMKRSKDKQKQDVINFIKANPTCSIIDIQTKTKVNVERLFDSIIHAYELAGVKYPERSFNTGVMNPLVLQRSNKFEKDIISLLAQIGEIKSQVKNKEGFADCLFRFKDETFVVEIKDYRGKNNITMSEIKQLKRYMDAMNHKKGLIVCPKESFPKRKNSRNLYIGDKNIKIVSKEDILWGHSINQLVSTKMGTAWLE
tara:strand:- start:3007 stop:3762 length:756 start_codon:yes stop_codon:yes gene_type:complete